MPEDLRPMASSAGVEERPLAEPPAAEPARAPASTSLARGLLRAARPKQWAKNVLVAAAPGAAGVLGSGLNPLRVALAFVAFCLVASGMYLLNDAADIEADRRHPVKRHRPIASGVVPLPVAIAAGIALTLVGLGVALTVNWGLLLAVGIYVAITLAYTLWLKHLAVIDIATVAAGFIIRAIAGGVAVDVPISRWFLIVASFGSLFVVAGKRTGERLDLGEDRALVRATLGAYSHDYLHFVWTMAAGVTVAAYCLWAFEGAEDAAFPWYELTIVPFVVGILRYALLLEAGRGGAPEEVILGDRTIQVLGGLWVLLFAGAVYL